MTEYITLEEIIAPLVEAETTTIKRSLFFAVKLSSGKYSYEKLQRHNYPYGLGPSNAFGPRGTGLSKDRAGIAQGEGVPYGDSAKINQHTGLFASSWKISEPILSGDELISELENTAPYQEELANGIPGLTIPRPTIERISEQLEYVRENNISRVVNAL